MTAHRHKTKRRRFPATAWLALLLATGAAAQETAPAEEPVDPDLRRYTVEIIVFAYAEDVGVGSERFVPDEPLPEPLPGEDVDAPEAAPGRVEPDVVPNSGVEEPLPGTVESQEEPGVQFALLTEDELTLGTIVEKLERLDAYEPLMHFGWTQTVTPDEPVQPLELHAFGRPPDGLDGRFTLYLTRFLHLVVDLDLDAPGGNNAGVPVADSRRGEYSYRDAYERPAPPVHYRIREERIVKNGELRYFDHPKFGVLARVARVEDDGEESGLPIDGSVE